MKKVNKGNRYTQIMVVSQRARQLIDGVEPVIESNSTKPVTIAIEELREGKIDWEHHRD